MCTKVQAPLEKSKRTTRDRNGRKAVSLSKSTRPSELKKFIRLSRPFASKRCRLLKWTLRAQESKSRRRRRRCGKRTKNMLKNAQQTRRDVAAAHTHTQSQVSSAHLSHRYTHTHARQVDDKLVAGNMRVCWLAKMLPSNFSKHGETQTETETRFKARSVCVCVPYTCMQQQQCRVE